MYIKITYIRTCTWYTCTCMYTFTCTLYAHRHSLMIIHLRTSSLTHTTHAHTHTHTHTHTDAYLKALSQCRYDRRVLPALRSKYIHSVLGKLSLLLLRGRRRTRDQDGWERDRARLEGLTSVSFTPAPLCYSFTCIIQTCVCTFCVCVYGST